MDIVETRLYAASSHSEADINSIGRRVVSDSLSDTNWRVPKPSHWLELLRNAPDSRWFDFARDSLSSAEHTGGGDKRPVKQWGAPVSLDEVIDTSALPDFKKTRWKDYLLQRQPPEPARAISISSTQLHRTRKQEPVPLHELIPKPHVHPVPTKASSTAIQGTQKFHQSPIRTYVQAKSHVEKTLADPWSRVSWVIPVHGSLSHILKQDQGLSLASRCLVSSAYIWQENYAPGPKPKELQRNSTSTVPPSETIPWDPTAISLFWSELLALRDSQRHGCLALIYHISSPTCCFIKVNCEGPKAMAFRHHFANWSCMRNASDRVSFSVPRDTRLSLVDATGKILAIS